MPAHCEPRCSLGKTESKLVLAKESRLLVEISVNTKYKQITLENEENLRREQLAILIAAETASDHIDFLLHNSFYDGFSELFLRTERLRFRLVKFGKS